jgi:hypothetical protein
MRYCYSSLLRAALRIATADLDKNAVPPTGRTKPLAPNGQVALLAVDRNRTPRPQSYPADSRYKHNRLWCNILAKPPRCHALTVEVILADSGRLGQTTKTGRALGLFPSSPCQTAAPASLDSELRKPHRSSRPDTLPLLPPKRSLQAEPMGLGPQTLCLDQASAPMVV